MGEAAQTTTPVLLFDGVCNLCNRSVQFILDHERAPSLKFAPLQSDFGRGLLSNANPSWIDAAAAPDSLVLFEGRRVYVRSSAALRAARHLRAPYRWLWIFLVIPRPIRDLVYRWIAKHRYRWFGRTETCRVPTPELRARFLGDPPS